MLRFFLVVCRSPPERKGRREEAIPDPPCPLIFLAAVRGEDAPPLYIQFQKAFLTIPGFFRGYFVNFKLFNVIFI